MLKFLILIKIVLLAVMLAFVLWSMKVIDARAVAKAFAALGIETGSNVEAEQVPMKICRSRVQALVFADGRKVEERVEGLKMNWMAHDPTPREVSYLDMEKWLSKHCQIEGQLAGESDQGRSAYHDFLTIRFVDGTSLKIQQAGEPGGRESLFRIGERLVRSVDLLQAFDELMAIAQFNNAASGSKAP